MPKLKSSRIQKLCVSVIVYVWRVLRIFVTVENAINGVCFQLICLSVSEIKCFFFSYCNKLWQRLAWCYDAYALLAPFYSIWAKTVNAILVLLLSTKFAKIWHHYSLFLSKLNLSRVVVIVATAGIGAEHGSFSRILHAVGANMYSG